MIEIPDLDFQLSLKQIGDNTRSVANNFNELGLENVVLLAVNEHSFQFAMMVKHLLAAFYNVDYNVERIGVDQIDPDDPDLFQVYSTPWAPALLKKNVFMINAAVDTGDSQLAVMDFLDFKYKHIRSVRIGAMTTKGKSAHVAPELTTFKIDPSSYVVGFGLDYNGKHHELEGLRTLTEEEKKEKKKKKERQHRRGGAPGRKIRLRR